MLYSVADLKQIESVPHTGEYQRWCTALDEVDPQAYQRISSVQSHWLVSASFGWN